MNYLGVDFHKHTSYVTKLDAEGKLVAQFEMRNDRETLRGFAG